VQAGEIVLKRSIYGGSVRWTFPHRVVGEWNGRTALYCAPGNQGKWIRRGDGFRTRWMTGESPCDTEWARTHVLRFEGEGTRHSVEIFWSIDWQHLGWYLNLQAPTTFKGRFVDTTDEALDVVVWPDGRWEWKDEDHLVEAVELGVWTQNEADEIRSEGERAIAAQPWPTGWEDWRPPASWGPLGLPRDWHVV
jgi:hypothetical protein